MIKFENTAVMNFDNAIRGMRNPMNSWEKSDSDSGCCERNVWGKIEKGNLLCKDCAATYESHCVCNGTKRFIIGENDLKLAQSLIKAGSDHRKFMRQIFVSVDITAPLYWWKEFDTYKVGTVANSCSTMHKIHEKEFTREDFSTEHLGCLISANDIAWDTEEYFEEWLVLLNVCREQFIKTKDKSWWWQMIQLLPSSYNQKRTITMNYENILNMYHARKNHKLDEWREGFTTWVSTLPYAKELIMEV